MEIRSSRLFKKQVAALIDYLKDAFGKRTAIRIKDEIEKTVFLLKLYPNMGAVEPLLEKESLVYRYILVKHNKILYTVEENYIFIHLLWDCRQNSSLLKKFIKNID